MCAHLKWNPDDIAFDSDKGSIALAIVHMYALIDTTFMPHLLLAKTLFLPYCFGQQINTLKICRVGSHCAVGPRRNHEAFQPLRRNAAAA